MINRLWFGIYQEIYGHLNINRNMFSLGYVMSIAIGKYEKMIDRYIYWD